MIPMQRLALEKERDNHSKDNQGHNLLNDFKLHKAERATVTVEAETVGRNLGAIFKESQSPREEDDQNERPARRDFHLLKFQMAVPRECHKYVGEHQQEDCSYRFHHNANIKTKCKCNNITEYIKKLF